MFGWLGTAMGNDGGLAEVIKPGDRVRHRGTRQWGRVLEVVPHDKTAELKIEREVRFEGDSSGEGWWATYHVDQYEPAAAGKE